MAFWLRMLYDRTLFDLQSYEYQRVLDGELAQRADTNRQLREVRGEGTLDSAGISHLVAHHTGDVTFVYVKLPGFIQLVKRYSPLGHLSPSPMICFILMVLFVFCSFTHRLRNG